MLQDATWYYWTWAASHAFLAVRLERFQTSDGPVAWPEALARELLQRQRADGSWVNRFTDAKEDDPLIATSWAAARWRSAARWPPGSPTCPAADVPWRGEAALSWLLQIAGGG